MDYFSMAFLIAVLQIIAIDILLGGDNAVVIALACRKLPVEQRNKGIFWGVAGAIGLRVVLIFFALQLLTLPFLKVVGALLLFWIGVKLLQPEDDSHGNVEGATTLAGAIKTIAIAVAVMSLDNVIAVAAAAQGNVVLLVLGLAIGIPLAIFGSTLMIKLMERFPIIVVLGAALIGWVGGETIASDAILHDYAVAHPALHYVAAALGAALVVGVGKFWRKGSDSASAT